MQLPTRSRAPGKCERRGSWRSGVCAGALTAAALFAACGGDVARENDVSTVGPTSSPALLFGVEDEAAVSSLPIRRDPTEEPRVLYSIRLDENVRRSVVDVRSTIQAVVCRATDISGRNKKDHPCKGTQPYDFDPRVFWKVVAADSPADTEGHTELAGWRSVRCIDAVHHCPIPFKVDGLAMPRAGSFVNLVAAAQSGSAEEGQTVAISANRGELQVIQAIAPTGLSRTAESGPVSRSFRMSRGSKRAGPEDLLPAVLFSQPVEVDVGDVIDVRTKLALRIRRSQDNAPKTSTQIILTPGRADTADPRLPTGRAATNRAGENCLTKCSLTRLGTIRSPVAGSMHVNVVMWVQDHEYETRGFVDYDGALEVTKRE